MDLREIMAAFAARAGFGDLSPDGDGVYNLGIDDMEIRLMESGETGSLVTWGSVGRPPPEGEGLLFRTLLESMFMGSATGGSSFSIDRESGEIFLQRVDPLATLDPDSFWTMLEKFINILSEWRGIVDSHSGVAPERARAERDGLEEMRRFRLGQVNGIPV